MLTDNEKIIMPFNLIEVILMVESEAEAKALEKFMQATPKGRARMLVEAEAQAPARIGYNYGWRVNMTEKVCPFGDIKEGYPFSSPLASYWKIKVVWGRHGPNNAMRQDNGVKVCFADVEPVIPIVRGDPDFSIVESDAGVYPTAINQAGAALDEDLDESYSDYEDLDGGV